MLGERFDPQLRAGGALRDGRSRSLLEGFAQRLRKAGYAAITVRANPAPLRRARSCQEVNR